MLFAYHIVEQKLSCAAQQVYSPMTELGQNRKSSMRAYDFRFAPESGHCATESACPFRAIFGLMHHSKQRHSAVCNAIS
jgi:hypothetical protein